MAFGQSFRTDILDYIFNGGTLRAPGGNVWISLHTGAPGVNGAANEVTGNAYARKATTAADWGAATVATPATISNSTVLTFTTATPSGWGTVSHFGVWMTSAVTVSAADFIDGGALTASQAVGANQTPNFPIGALTFSLT